MTENAGLPLLTDDEVDARPLAAWFLGPRAENAETWQELISYILQDHVHWRRNYFPNDPVVVNRLRRRSAGHELWLDELTTHLDSVLNDLKEHFPFHSPRYVAHMLSENTLPSFLGFFAGMLFNPNNVTDEAAPITVSLELEVGRMISSMLGYNPTRSWAHLCSGGTVANLEALWIARMAQFAPFIVREFCADNRLDFVIKTASGSEQPIAAIDDQKLIGLRPNESIFMLRKLARFMHETKRQPFEEIFQEINAHVGRSTYNLASRGIGDVLNRIGMNPVIFVSSAAHYSIKKAANVLGYGEAAVRLVPVNSRFQVNIDILRAMLFDLAEDEYVAAVIGIVGTTEEGAVDAIHKIRFLRDELAKERERAFWLHVDAAWGGYIRSIFCGLGLKRPKTKRSLEEICDEYVRAIQAEESFSIDASDQGDTRKTVTVRWAEREIYAAFIAMSDADSTTIDPHKMGFVPYPAGVVAFRNGLVTELVVQKAQYISDEAGGIRAIDELAKIEAVGPYILEGSKPGATALACWLAHKTIPLEVSGHGKIVRTTLLNAKKLFKHLVNHRHLFRRTHSKIFDTEDCAHPFTFIPLFEPDTNVVCFIARPMGWQDGILVPIDVSLKWINLLNEKIYASLSIPTSQRRKRRSQAQPYFVSRTRFDREQYNASSISSVLKLVGASESEYSRVGLFVLRSVVMNPWHYLAEKASMNYLLGFIEYLHEVATWRVQEVYDEWSGAGKG